jgi:muramoyltetrapeptide carboxypeptidase
MVRSALSDENRSMKKHWSYLQKNDVVDVVAPASHSPLEKLREGVEWIRKAGFIPHVPSDIIQTDVFFAAPLEVQLDHLKKAIYSDSKAIWCLRGGYGSMRLIPYLNKLKPPKRPKLFVGFSDITSLHLFFAQRWNWPTIHGRTISQLSPETFDSPDRKLLLKIITGKTVEHTFKKLIPLNQHAQKDLTMKGEIIGGNLRILQSSLGTTWELKAKGKILFIEDVAERGYSIDRMLEQMIQAKIIDKNLKAVIFGDFTEGKEKDGSDLSAVAIERFAAKVPYPVLKGLPAGHGHPLNYPIPFHTQSILKLGKKAELTCTYGGKK